MAKYVEVKKNSAKVTHLKIEVYYSLGGYNVFTGKEEKRGYYLSVMPVEKGNGMETFVAFSGIKECVKTVKRQSKKAEAEAKEIAETVKAELIQEVCGKNLLELA